jgi:hypothetical protein
MAVSGPRKTDPRGSHDLGAESCQERSEQTATFHNNTARSLAKSGCLAQVLGKTPHKPGEKPPPMGKDWINQQI